MVSRYPSSYPRAQNDESPAGAELRKSSEKSRRFWLPEQGSNLRQFD